MSHTGFTFAVHVTGASDRVDKSADKCMTMAVPFALLASDVKVRVGPPLPEQSYLIGGRLIMFVCHMFV